MAKREIERKFRLRRKPALKRAKGVSIRQGYLISAEGELRLRAEGKKCFITVKSEGEESRREWEERIPRWVFDLLWGHTAGRRVEKTRYRIPLRRTVAEVDVYDGPLRGLVIVEFEFSSEKKAKAFTLPKRFGGAEEVTLEPRYRNRSLAAATSPPAPRRD
jgi:CYTH domain-containing protein